MLAVQSFSFGDFSKSELDYYCKVDSGVEIYGNPSGTVVRPPPNTKPSENIFMQPNGKNISHADSATPRTALKSWASLFHGSRAQKRQDNSSPDTSELPRKNFQDDRDDSLSQLIAKEISGIDIFHKSPELMTRGFINPGNWCYGNAVVQTLLRVSPLCRLMATLPSRKALTDGSLMLSSTPILDSFVKFVKDLKFPLKEKFENAESGQLQCDFYKPTCIHQMTSIIAPEFSLDGRQEDAQEFLCFVLNGLHQEMEKVIELQACEFNSEKPSDINEIPSRFPGKLTVLCTAHVLKNPISELFQGQLRSDIFQKSHRVTTKLEPFFSLPLDISDQKVDSFVYESLKNLTTPEIIEDYANDVTKSKGVAARKVSLETLPRILILHLKRFGYDSHHGSVKLCKQMRYFTHLVIGKELMSKQSKNLTRQKRAFKLFAVLYHHGRSATAGHYTVDVYHGGLNSWLRIDDHRITKTTEANVVRHNAERTAYLLFYKRIDLTTN